MTLTPNFLPVGSVVEYNLGDKDFPNWSPTSLDWQDLKRLDENPGLFNCEHRGIKLTPEILTGWCGFEKCINGYWCPLEYINVKLHDSGTYSIYTSGGDTNLASKGVLALHQLQHLYSALTQTVLPITIK